MVALTRLSACSIEGSSSAQALDVARSRVAQETVRQAAANEEGVRVVVPSSGLTTAAVVAFASSPSTPAAAVASSPSTPAAAVAAVAANAEEGFLSSSASAAASAPAFFPR